jgi:O-antigen/teichoic acid export membrane protein
VRLPRAVSSHPHGTGDSRPAEHRVLRGALALLSTQPITWATSLAIAVLVPRYLGAEALGQYGVASGVAVLVATLASFGIQSYLTRQVATDARRAQVLVWAGIAIVTAGAVAISLLLLLVVAVFRIPGMDLALLAMSMCGGALTLIQGVLVAVFIGRGENARAAWSMAASTFLAAATGLTVLVLGGGVYEYAFAFLVGWIIAVGVMIATSGIPPTRAALDPAIAHELIRGGMPFMGWNLALRLGGLDIIVTGVLAPSIVAGWLVAAYRIINVTVFIPTVITTPLMPALTRCKGRVDEYRSLLEDSLATVIFLTVPVAGLIFALAPIIPDVMGWPASLQNAIPVMVILAFQQPLVAVDMVLGVSLIALGLERPWLKVAIVAAVFNLGTNVLAVPLAQSLLGNGAIGAAAVELVTELIFLAGALRLTPAGLLGRADLSRAARIVVAGVALIVVASALRTAGLPVAFVGGGVAYLVAGAGLGVVGPRQIRAVRLALRPA